MCIVVSLRVCLCLCMCVCVHVCACMCDVSSVLTVCLFL